MLQDLRYAVRIALQNKAWTAVVVLSLALGIGANTALYSLVDALYMRQLPVENPDRLVFFDWLSGPRRMNAGYTGNSETDPDTGISHGTSFSSLTFERFRNESETLSDVFAFAPLYRVNVNLDGQADLAQAQLVSGNYFNGLHVPAVAGRTIVPEDDHPSAAPVAVISDRYWQRAFDRDPTAIGKTVFVNSVPLTIVGVTPQGFESTLGFGLSMDISIPLAFESQIGFLGASTSFQSQPWVWWLPMMARMRPGVTPQQVHAELERIFQASASDGFSAAPEGPGPVGTEPRDTPQLRVHAGGRGLNFAADDAYGLLPVLTSVFGLLLLIVCVNVANLLFARAATREREMGIRVAVGGSRSRLLRQLLTESVMLAIVAGTIGTVFAYWGKDLLTNLLPGDSFTSPVYDLRIDPRVLAFAAGVSLLTGALFGIAPAFRATRMNLNYALKENARNLSNSRSRAVKVLVAAQVSMSIVLLVGAGLLLRTLQNSSRFDAGFDAGNLLLFQIDPGSLAYENPRIAALYEQMQERISTLPGVLGATTSEFPLVGTAGSGTSIYTEGSNLELLPNQRGLRRQRVGANFFETLGIQVLAGRSFIPDDGPGVPAVGVINETLARRFFPDANPVGRRFGFGTIQRSADIQIVGVAKDVQTTAVRDAIPPMVYLPSSQSIPPGTTFEVRTAGDPLEWIPAVRSAMREIDPNVPLFDFKTQTQQVAQSFTTERTLAAASTLFGFVALSLVCIGLYGLLSYNVTRRTGEIGIRMALGARRVHVIRAIVGQTCFLVCIGIVIGLFGSLVLTKGLDALLYGVAPNDPLIMISAAGVMLLVAVLAGYLPALKASRVAPMAALRHE